MAQESKFVLEGDKWVIEKDPDANLDYVWSWASWLAKVNDTIASHSVTVAGVTLGSHSHTNTTVTVWLSGGQPSKSRLASATVRVTTVGGRVDERTGYFRIVPR